MLLGCGNKLQQTCIGIHHTHARAHIHPLSPLACLFAIVLLPCLPTDCNVAGEAAGAGCRRCQSKRRGGCSKAPRQPPRTVHRPFEEWPLDACRVGALHSPIALFVCLCVFLSVCLVYVCLLVFLGVPSVYFFEGYLAHACTTAPPPCPHTTLPHRTHLNRVCTSR